MPRKRVIPCLACAGSIHHPRSLQLCDPCLDLVNEYEGADAARLSRVYGLGIERYGRLFAMQRGRCAICLERKPLVVDHDHASGEVRGLLCNLCNLALGLLRDRSDLALMAATYLEEPTALTTRATRAVRVWHYK